MYSSNNIKHDEEIGQPYTSYGVGDYPINNNNHLNYSPMFTKSLRVLVFDEDPQYLLIIENYLLEFQYQVTGCDKEEKAMYLLRNQKNMFDIAIVDAHNAQGVRFRVISEIGSEMDLPIIIISKDMSYESVTNWMRNGAWDYLIKPIRREDLWLIFKHVARKRQVKRCVEEIKGVADKSSSAGGYTVRSPNNGRKVSTLLLDKQVNGNDSDRGIKKRRVVWDDTLHGKFMEAVNSLGIDDCVPKKILERMNVDYITRENVASHLQKLRLSVKKMNGKNISKRNQSLLALQNVGMYNGGEGASTDQFYGEANVYIQSLTHIITSTIFMYFMPPFENNHYYDGASLAFPSGNIMMPTTNDQNQQHGHGENHLVYNEDDDYENKYFASMQNFGTTSLFNGNKYNHLYANPQKMTMNIHEPSMLPPSFTGASSFFNQQEPVTMFDGSGRFINNNDPSSVNNNANQPVNQTNEDKDS
ncbi:unnamed protein product [Cochlearia groenlandica]